MIERMRKGFHKNVFQVVLWMTILSLLLPTAGALFFKSASSDAGAIASVNGEKISFKDWRRQTAEEERRLRQIRQQFGKHADEIFKLMGINTRADITAIQKLIQDTLLSQLAKPMALHPHDTYIAHKLSDPAFLVQILGESLPQSLFDVQGNLREQVFLNYLKRHGTTLHDFEHLIESSIQKWMLSALIEGSFPTIKAFAQEHALRDASKKKFSIKKYSSKSYLTQAENSSEKAKELFAQDLALGVTPEEALSASLTGWLQNDQQKEWEDLKKQGLPVHRMQRMIHVGDTFHILDGNVGTVITVVSLEPVSVQSANNASLEQASLQHFSHAFIDSLRKNATIIENKKMLAA